METDVLEVKELEFYVFAKGASHVLAGGPDKTLREVLVGAEILKEGKSEDVLVFVGECTLALDEPHDAEDGTDEDAPVDIDLTLEVLELHRHKHVHVHHCRHIAVTVDFTSAKKHRFSPSTTIETVTRWARKKFDLSGPSADEFVLQISGTTIRPGMHEHLSQVVQGHECSITFDLVKEGTPKG